MSNQRFFIQTTAASRRYNESGDRIEEVLLENCSYIFDTSAVLEACSIFYR